MARAWRSAVAGRSTITVRTWSTLTVNGNGGSDTFTVTPSATTSIFIDGGDPIGVLPGDLLTIVPGGAAVTFNAGPRDDAGSFVVGANQPLNFVISSRSGSTGDSGHQCGCDQRHQWAGCDHGHRPRQHAWPRPMACRTSPPRSIAVPRVLFIDFLSLTINAVSGSDE